MDDSLLVILLVCIMFVIIFVHGVMNHWLNNAACKRFIHDLRDVNKGTCPKCHSCHPEAVRRSGFHEFWTTLRCPECKYRVTVHIDSHQVEEDV